MNLVFTNLFIYACILIFALFFLVGLNDFSFSLSFLDIQNIDVRIIVMFILAEPHFAMTIPLLYGYRHKFVESPLIFINVPILIAVISALLFFFQSGLFFLIFLVANVYHVNRQSVGFLKIQVRASELIAKTYEVALHILTIFCIYIALVQKNHSFFSSALLLAVGMLFMIFTIIILEKRCPKIKEFWVLLQGFLIFLPIAFFEDILLAFAVGISIHYIQYLVISWNVLTKGFGFKIMPLLMIITFYSLLSTGALSGFFTKERISMIIFLPTILQLLHFYDDGFNWRRSEQTSSSIMKKALS